MDQPSDDGSDLEEFVVYADDDRARGRLAQVRLSVSERLQRSMLGFNLL